MAKYFVHVLDDPIPVEETPSSANAGAEQPNVAPAAEAAVEVATVLPLPPIEPPQEGGSSSSMPVPGTDASAGCTLDESFLSPNKKLVKTAGAKKSRPRAA
eukprot:9973613-Lingulodinium_polyedra.AAC.1